jgi:uncharacterized membrane protein
MKSLPSATLARNDLGPVLNETPLERRAFHLSIASAALLLAAFFAWVHHDGNESGFVTLFTHAGISLAFAGKFIVFVGLEPGSPSPWQLAAMVFLLDLFFALLLASGIQQLERMPLLGRGLRKARTRALELSEQYPGLKRSAFLGVTLFVFLPLAATGAITGSFIARIFGLSRVSRVAAIALGSGITALIFATHAHFIGQQARTFLENPVLAGISTLVLLFVGWRAYLAFLSRLRA